MNRNNIAIIPARSGSKGLKDKNIKEFLGAPLISYTISAALESSCFDEVIVSTDSEVYAKIAKQYGAKVPFIRSTENATDKSSTWEVVKEVLEFYEKKNIFYTNFTILQPTSPLRTKKHIQEATALFYENVADSIVSAKKIKFSPAVINKLDSNGSSIEFGKLNLGEGRQSYDDYYELNGAIYIVKTESFRKNKNIYTNKSFLYVMSALDSLDIDNYEDFILAEQVMKMKEGLHE